MSDLTILSLKAWLFVLIGAVFAFAFDMKLGGIIMLGLATAYFFARDVVAALREKR